MGTIEINGTGGIIEGNLGSANVNVNLDAVHTFDGTDDYLAATSAKGDVQWNTTSFSATAWVYMTDSGRNIIMACTPSGTNTGWGIMVDEDDASHLFSLSLSFSGLASAGTGKRVCGVTGADILHKDVWHHIAVTFNGADYTAVGNYNFYVDGRLVTAGKGILADFTSRIDGMTANTMWIGRDRDNFMTGNLADCRVYDDILTATEIAEIASKINYESSSAGNLIGRWKIAGTSIDLTDSSANSNTASASGSPATAYPFSVDVYDNSTTTDGSFKITQGKVEGLGLTSVDFIGNGTTSGGTHDSIATTNTGSLSLVKSTIACWIKPESVTGSGSGEQVILSSAYYNNNDFHLGQRNISKRFAFSVGHGDLLQFDLDITADKWHHLILSYTSGGGTDWLSAINIYLDGVEIPTANYIGPTSSGTCETLTTESVLHIGGKSGTGYFDGNIRDMRIYDYALSADQAASLYSGSYNATPLHWWKMDEGTGATATIEDYGTGTSGDGTGAGLDWDNGTLDLDGTLTISANGSLSAPRGDLDLAGNFTIAADTSTYTHNSGTFKPSANCEFLPTDFDSSENARHIFHNVAHTGGTLYIERPCKIEGTYTKTGGELRHYAKVTFGTDAASGNMTINHTTWNMYGYYGNPFLYAANELFPVNIGGSVSDPIDWDVVDQRAVGGQNTVTHIKGINFGNTGGTPATKNTVTGGGYARIALDGDCEFDGFTLSANDELDLNGQRMECSGTLTNNGTIDFDGFVYAPVIDSDGATANKSSGTVVLQPTSDVTLDLRDDATLGTLMVNATTNRVNIAGTNNAASATNLFVGTGTLDLADKVMNYTDMNIATGGTLDADSSTINVAGDFTTSGGLIGKSAADFITDDGTTNGNYINCGNSSNSDSWGNMSVECWVKLDHIGRQSEETTFFSRGSNAIPKFGLSGGKLRFYAGSSSKALNGNTTLTTGKWYHSAMSYNNSTGLLNLYLDGKLDGSATIDTGCLTADVGVSCIGAQSTGNRHMDGLMGKISVWNHELTQDEIRKLMFMTGAEMQADNTNFPDGTANDCKFFYNFDEGTGDNIADSGPGGNNATWQTRGSQGAAWAGAGDGVSTGFIRGGSTLVMSGTGTMTVPAGFDVNNLTVGASGQTTTLKVPSANDNLDVRGLLTIDSGTFTDASSPNADVAIYDNQTPVCNGSSTFANIDTVIFWADGNMNIPATTFDNVTFGNSKVYTGAGAITVNTLMTVTDNATFTAGGDMTISEELQVDSGTTFNANGNTIALKTLDNNGGALDLRNSNLEFSITGDGDSCDFGGQYGGTLLTGNTTITGHSSGNKTGVYARAVGNFEVVGDIKFLNIQADGDGDLTVIGSVIDCTAAAGAGLRQWHHTLDTQQLLDADSDGDDDLRLTKPSLDNSHELQTG